MSREIPITSLHYKRRMNHATSLEELAVQLLAQSRVMQMAALHIDSDSPHMTLEMFSMEKLRTSSNAMVADLMRAFDAVRECGERMRGK